MKYFIIMSIFFQLSILSIDSILKIDGFSDLEYSKFEKRLVEDYQELGQIEVLRVKELTSIFIKNFIKYFTLVPSEHFNQKKLVFVIEANKVGKIKCNATVFIERESIELTCFNNKTKIIIPRILIYFSELDVMRVK